MALRTRARKLQKLMGWPYQKCVAELAKRTLQEQKDLLEEVEKDKSEEKTEPTKETDHGTRTRNHAEG